MNEQKIFDYLSSIIENPKCELNYTSPFELLVAVILSSQCTDKRVNEVTKYLFKKWNTPNDFAKLSQSELEKEIYSIGFYHNKAKNIIEMSKQLLDNFSGTVPSTLEDLITLKGVGRKTANVILCEIFDKSTLAVDTHLFRIAHRLNLSDGKTPYEVEKDLIKKYKPNQIKTLHHLFILFGRYHCKAINPNCTNCELKNICKYYKSKNEQ